MTQNSPDFHTLLRRTFVPRVRHLSSVIHRSDGRTTVKPTCDFSFERAAHDVLRPAVFDGDEIVARCHWCVGDFVAFGTLPTVHLNLGWTVDVDRQSAWACITGVDDKLRSHACKTKRRSGRKTDGDIFLNLRFLFNSQHKNLMINRKAKVFGHKSSFNTKYK